MRRFFVLLLLFCLCGTASAEERRLNLKIFPTVNRTEFQVWESKFYPYSVLEENMTEYLASLFMDYPLIDVEVFDVTQMNQWLNSPRRQGDMAAQMELYRARLKTRDNVLGTFDSGTVAIRVKIYDAVSDKNFAEPSVQGKDRRYTFSPSDEQLFFLNAMIGLPIPFKDGIDLLGLTKRKYKGQEMSSLTWGQFNDTSAWQAFMNAIKEAQKQILTQANTAMQRNGNEPESYFTGGYTNVGRLISPTANSTRKRREYIISIGEMDSIKVGDVLEVVRPDTYITVDAEKPIVLVQNTVGKVKVIRTQPNEAIVVVISEKDKKEPIQLNDVVVKQTGKLR